MADPTRLTGPAELEGDFLSAELPAADVNVIPPELPSGGDRSHTRHQRQQQHPLHHPPPPASQPSVVEITEIITNLERQTIDARTNPSATLYNKFLAAHSKAVSSEGIVTDARFSTAEWRQWLSADMTEISVICATPDVAVIHYGLEVHYRERPRWPVKQRRSSTWQRLQGEEGRREWRMVFRHITEIKK